MEVLPIFYDVIESAANVPEYVGECCPYFRKL